jgi:GNAT superfamily N-acetyltransferase
VWTIAFFLRPYFLMFSASRRPVLNTIRDYHNKDARQVGILIADTYAEFNLSFASPEERSLFLGPFQQARSSLEAHQKDISRVIHSEMVYVAEDAGEIVGVLRGREERLGSLFVRKASHRRGVGRRLVQRFEQESIQRGVRVIRVAATLYAVPFYLAMGYKRSTGLRLGWSFEGHGLQIQPMRKVLGRPAAGG